MQSLQKYIEKDIKTLVKLTNNELFLSLFNKNDWIILGYGIDRTNFIWAIKINDYDNFRHIKYKNFLLVLDTKKNDFNVHPKTTNLSNAQDWFAKPSLKLQMFLEKKIREFKKNVDL